MFCTVRASLICDRARPVRSETNTSPPLCSPRRASAAGGTERYRRRGTDLNSHPGRVPNWVSSPGIVPFRLSAATRAGVAQGYINWFREPDADPLTHGGAASAADVAVVSASGSRVVVTPVSEDTGDDPRDRDRPGRPDRDPAFPVLVARRAPSPTRSSVPA